MRFLSSSPRHDTRVGLSQYHYYITIYPINIDIEISYNNCIYQLGDTYVRVERNTGGSNWVTEFTDAHWETRSVRLYKVYLRHIDILYNIVAL